MRRPRNPSRLVPALLAPAAIAALSLAGCSTGGGSAVDGDAPAAVSAVGAEVARLAVDLEGHYRGGDYPTDVDGVLASLDEAGLEVAPGTEIAGYTYDPEAVEFELCVQDEAGAWATYDTAPMSLRESGESGGCPTA